MTTPSPNVQAALATLQDRLGEAAPRWGVTGPSGRAEVLGALAVAPRPVEVTPGTSDRAISTGFLALDAILGLGGFPRTAATALRGEGTSGKTTLALQAVAQAQAIGGIVAYLDLARSLDPVEAVGRGVQLEWLVVLTPDSLEEALSMAAMLLQDRTVDLLLLDMPNRPLSGAGLSAAVLAERLDRLAALARRAGVQLLVLEPPNLPPALAGVLTQVSALRLELSRRAWIRLGRDVVGQRTEVRVARDRFGPPGRATELRIMYAEGGLRDACLRRGDLLRETVGRAGFVPVARPRLAPPMRLVPAAAFRAVIRADSRVGSGAGAAPPGGSAPPGSSRPAALSRAVRPSPPPSLKRIPVPADATPPSLLAPPSASPGSQSGLGATRGRPDRSGGQAMDRR
jgi:recombination protein RecA